MVCGAERVGGGTQKRCVRCGIPSAEGFLGLVAMRGSLCSRLQIPRERLTVDVATQVPRMLHEKITAHAATIAPAPPPRPPASARGAQDPKPLGLASVGSSPRRAAVARHALSQGAQTARTHREVERAFTPRTPVRKTVVLPVVKGVCASAGVEPEAARQLVSNQRLRVSWCRTGGGASTGVEPEAARQLEWLLMMACNDGMQ